MTHEKPDLKWYTTISTSKSLSARCPFASVHRCPRYYASIAALGESGVTPALSPEEDRHLLETWKRTDVWPVTAEQEPVVSGQPGSPSMFANFCPEVLFDAFGWFASTLAYHADEIDTDNAHRELAKEGATTQDPRWIWSKIYPLHYSECRLYSPLLLGVNNTKSGSRIGFGGSLSDA